jgi:hypothetical protein
MWYCMCMCGCERFKSTDFDSYFQIATVGFQMGWRCERTQIVWWNKTTTITCLILVAGRLTVVVQAIVDVDKV